MNLMPLILAHGNAPDDFAELMRAWSFEPLVVTGTTTR